MSCSLTCPVTVHFGFGDNLSQNIRCLIDICLLLPPFPSPQWQNGCSKFILVISTIFRHVLWFLNGTEGHFYCLPFLYAPWCRPTAGFSHFKLLESDFQLRVYSSNHLTTHSTQTQHSLGIKIIIQSSERDTKPLKNSHTYGAWMKSWLKA